MCACPAQLGSDKKTPRSIALQQGSDVQALREQVANMAQTMASMTQRMAQYDVRLDLNDEVREYCFLSNRERLAVAMCWVRLEKVRLGVWLDTLMLCVFLAVASPICRL